MDGAGQSVPIECLLELVIKRLARYTCLLGGADSLGLTKQQIGLERFDSISSK